MYQKTKNMKFTGKDRIAKALVFMAEKVTQGFNIVCMKDKPRARNGSGITKVTYEKEEKKTNNQT